MAEFFSEPFSEFLRLSGLFLRFHVQESCNPTVAGWVAREEEIGSLEWSLKSRARRQLRSVSAFFKYTIKTSPASLSSIVHQPATVVDKTIDRRLAMPPFVLFVLLGIGILLPWNCLIMSIPFFTSYLNPDIPFLLSNGYTISLFLALVGVSIRRPCQGESQRVRRAQKALIGRTTIASDTSVCNFEAKRRANIDS